MTRLQKPDYRGRVSPYFLSENSSSPSANKINASEAFIPAHIREIAANSYNMNNISDLNQLEILLPRTASRRTALKGLGLGALGLAVLGTRASASGGRLNLSPEDMAIIDFALNLEYLEANFYSYATTGMSIEQRGVDITGRGKQGTVTVPATDQVAFNTTNVAQYAAEITKDEIAHVNFLRQVSMDAGYKPVAQPAIDLSNSFAAAGSAAGLGSGFSPFGSSTDDVNFLLGAFIFEDVGVTAYHGAIPSLSNATVVTSAAGILGTEAYHASNVRTELFEIGGAAISDAQAISNARNALGGEGLDQGIETLGISSVVPSDSNAIVFARTVRLVLNIVYLAVNAKKGGFFPDGINS